MKIYSFFSSEGSDYFTNKADAIAEARKVANQIGEPVAVEKRYMAFLPPAVLAIRLLQNSGWCAKTEVVATVHPRKSKAKNAA